MGVVKPFKRPEINEKDSFRYSTPDLKVVANPMSTYVAPRMSASAERFAQLTNTLGRSVAGAYQEYDRGQGEQGTNSAILGEERPDNASDTFTKAYDLQDGKAQAVEFNTKLQGLLDTNKEATQQELQTKVEALNAQYINGRSEAFQLGFGPVAQAGRTKAYGLHQQELTRQVNDTYISNVAQSAIADSGLAWSQCAGDVENYGQQSRKTLIYGAEIGKGVQTATTKEIHIAQAKALGEQAVRERNPNLLAGFYAQDKDGKSLIDDPDINQLVSQYTRTAKANEKSQNTNRAYDIIVSQCSNANGVVDWSKALALTTNYKFQKENGIDGETSLSLRGQIQSAMNAEVTNMTHQRDENYRKVAEKAYGIGDIALGVKYIRNNTTIDPIQKDRLIKAISGTQVSNPEALNQLRTSILSGDIQTAEGIYGMDGVSWTDKQSALSMLDKIKKPENKFIQNTLSSIDGLIRNPLSTKTPLYNRSVMEAYNEVLQDVDTWEKAGENVRTNLSKEYLAGVASRHQPSLQDMIKEMTSSMDSASESKVITDRLFKSYTPDFTGYVYDFFAKGGNLPGCKANKKLTWQQIEKIMNDDNARNWLKNQYQPIK